MLGPNNGRPEEKKDKKGLDWLFFHLAEDDCDVVPSACGKSGADKTVSFIVRRICGTEAGLNGIVIQHVCEAIGTKQKDIPIDCGALQNIAGHSRIRTYRPYKDIPSRMIPCLRCGEHPFIHLQLHQCMVSGQLPQNAVPQEINPAVPDMSNDVRRAMP